MFGNITVANFSRGSNVLKGIKLPAAYTSDDHYVSVALGIATTAPDAKTMPLMPTYFISYRVKNKAAGGFDAGLLPKHDGKVFVYEYNGKQKERQFGQRPTLIDFGTPFLSTNNTFWRSPFVKDPVSTAPPLGGAVQVGALLLR